MKRIVNGQEGHYLGTANNGHSCSGVNVKFSPKHQNKADNKILKTFGTAMQEHALA